MAIIKKLDEHLINMIAAGEVVERPSGIVKELIDNSIDAKAKNIIINIFQGGIDSLEVIDDGIGMDKQDAENAFVRHATSKIKNKEDLWSIHTLGFRGEALPSIASVSKVELITNDGNASTKVIYQYGVMTHNDVASSNQGTSVKVSGLFYKTPARLKHLKTVQYEASLISDIVLSFSLGYPGISFELYIDDKLSFRTTGNNSLKDIYYNVYGKEVSINSFNIENSNNDFSIKGICVLPHLNRANNNYIKLFINNRMIRYYKISKAIEESYGQYLPKLRFPICSLNISCDEKLVDVNVHPGKWQVRLSKEKELIDLIKLTINEALMKELKPINYKLKKDNVYEEETIIDNTSYVDQTLNFNYDLDDNVDMIINEDIKDTDNIRALCQLDEKYILANNHKGLYIFDQHASAERIKYEYYNGIFTKRFEREPLLIPLDFILSPKLVNKMDYIIEDLKKINIICEQFSINSIVIREVPVWVNDLKVYEFFTGLLDYYEDFDSIMVDSLVKHKVSTLACHNSIRFNHGLKIEEMNKLIKDLMLCKDPYHCPHGRTTFNLITYNELEKSFNR